MESNSGERCTIINSEFREKVSANSVYKANNWRAKSVWKMSSGKNIPVKESAAVYALR